MEQKKNFLIFYALESAKTKTCKVEWQLLKPLLSYIGSHIMTSNLLIKIVRLEEMQDIPRLTESDVLSEELSEADSVERLTESNLLVTASTLTADLKEVMVKALISFIVKFKSNSSNSLSSTCFTSTAIRESRPRLPKLLSLLMDETSFTPEKQSRENFQHPISYYQTRQLLLLKTHTCALQTFW